MFHMFCKLSSVAHSLHTVVKICQQCDWTFPPAIILSWFECQHQWSSKGSWTWWDLGCLFSRVPPREHAAFILPCLIFLQVCSRELWHSLRDVSFPTCEELMKSFWGSIWNTSKNPILNYCFICSCQEFYMAITEGASPNLRMMS